MHRLGGDSNRERWFRFKFVPDQLLECAVRDESGHTQDTILVLIKEKVETGPDGHFAYGKHVGASDPHYRWWAETGPGKGLRSRALYHFCDGNSAECGVTRGRQQIIHVEKFRPITEAMVTACNSQDTCLDVWAELLRRGTALLE